MMIDRLIHCDGDDKELFTLESPDKDGEISLTVHTDDSDSTIYLNKEQALSVIKFLSNINSDMKTKYQPEYFANAIVKPKSKTNYKLIDGFFYSHQEQDVIIVFTKHLCAN